MTHGPAELPGSMIFIAAVACMILAAPARADWEVVEVVKPSAAAATPAESRKPVPPVVGNGWAPVSGVQNDKSAAARRSMQSTVGPQSAQTAPDNDELPPLKIQQPPAKAPAAPSRVIAPDAPGLAASKLVPKPSAATPAKAPAAAPTPKNAAATPGKVEQPTAASPAAARAPAVPPSGPARQYCVNIADAAADARFAWKAKTLAEIGQELDKRIETLEQKTAEFQKWMARRDEFSKKAVAQLVSIYRRMAPDAAAAQLVLMDPETSAAVLAKLDARISSAILNEMQPRQAARLTTIIAGSAKIPSAETKTAERSTAQAQQPSDEAGEL